MPPPLPHLLVSPQVPEVRLPLRQLPRNCSKQRLTVKCRGLQALSAELLPEPLSPLFKPCSSSTQVMEMQSRLSLQLRFHGCERDLSENDLHLTTSLPCFSLSSPQSLQIQVQTPDPPGPRRLLLPTLTCHHRGLRTNQTMPGFA